MRKPSNLRSYRREIINLLLDEKTLDQISKYLSQEYSVDASTDDIREIVPFEKSAYSNNEAAHHPSAIAVKNRRSGIALPKTL